MDIESTKLFTVEEANSHLPRVRKILAELKRHYIKLRSMSAAARRAAESATSGGGGMMGGAIYIETLQQLADGSQLLQAIGIQIKDYEQGLIDFPSLKEGRVILLCWKLGEEKIEWWHETDAGFAGRQPL